MDDPAYLWGSRTARIVYQVRFAQLVSTVAGDIVTLRWGVLVDAARIQAARYRAGPRFVDGYLAGALSTLWQRLGWHRVLRCGEQDLAAPEPDWADAPFPVDPPRPAEEYRPILPLGVPV